MDLWIPKKEQQMKAAANNVQGSQAPSQQGSWTWQCHPRASDLRVMKEDTWWMKLQNLIPRLGESLSPGNVWQGSPYVKVLREQEATRSLCMNLWKWTGMVLKIPRWQNCGRSAKGIVPEHREWNQTESEKPVPGSNTGRTESSTVFDIRYRATGFGICLVDFQSYFGLIFFMLTRSFFLEW